jgi:hypothetical protein
MKRASPEADSLDESKDSFVDSDGDDDEKHGEFEYHSDDTDGSYDVSDDDTDAPNDKEAKDDDLEIISTIPTDEDTNKKRLEDMYDHISKHLGNIRPFPIVRTVPYLMYVKSQPVTPEHKGGLMHTYVKSPSKPTPLDINILSTIFYFCEQVSNNYIVINERLKNI